MEISSRNSSADVGSLFIQDDVRRYYSIGQVIGKGSFSNVHECTHKESGDTYALKIIDKTVYKKSKVVIENEIRILRKSCHSSITQLFEVYETDDNLYLVMELIKGGELYTYISEHGALSEHRAHKIFSEIFSGVAYLHSQRIVHRDLKLENILFSDSQRSIKLTDFGLSKIFELNDEQMMQTRCGTPCYVAPEILLGNEYTSAVDIWSMGVILYVMVFSQYPFPTTCLHTMYGSILSGTYEFPLPTLISADLRDLITRLLCVDVQKRITIEEISNHKWMKGKPLEETVCSLGIHEIRSSIEIDLSRENSVVV